MPTPTAAGDIVSYDIYYVNTPHIHQQYRHQTLPGLLQLTQSHCEKDAHRQRGRPDIKSHPKVLAATRRTTHDDITARATTEWGLRTAMACDGP
eukprot:6181661-Pleurochrysis_carterae.AAC.1